MNRFLQQRKRKNKLTTAPFVTVVIFFVLVFASILFFFPNTLTGSVHIVMQPLWTFKNTIVDVTVNTFNLIQSKQKLILENKNLENQLKEMHFRVRASDFLYEENQALKDLLGRHVEENTILASVLTRPNVSVYDTFVVDAGRSLGVEKGNYVIVPGGIVIGLVSEVFKTTAIVKPFSTPGEEISVVMGSQRITTIATGRGGGNFVAELPRDIGVEEGDNIIMPGISPKLFGVVEKIIADTTQPFQTILFKNPVNIAELKWVQILRSNDQQSTTDN